MEYLTNKNIKKEQKNFVLNYLTFSVSNISFKLFSYLKILIFNSCFFIFLKF